jgi:hypothetical protein
MSAAGIDESPPPGSSAGVLPTARPRGEGRAAAAPQRKGKTIAAERARQRGPEVREADTPGPREPIFAAGFAALCALLTLVFFREFVLRPGTMPFGSDMLEEAYPLRNFAVEELAAGRPFPVWNPFSYSGIPFLETLPYPVYYPTSLLYFLIPLGRAIGWTFVLHFFAAGIFMFAFARRLGVSRWGAALAGLAFMLNGYLVSHLYAGQDGRMFAMSLMPLVFYFLRVGLDTRRLGPYLLMGGVVALQIFTPHVQVMYFSSLAAAAYFVTEAVRSWRREGPRTALAHAWKFGAAFTLAAVVAAVELWPTWTFLKWGVRGVLTGYAYASSWAMPPSELSALIAPDLVGSLESYWGTNPFKLHTEYLGAIPLLLAFAALLWGEARRVLFWALLGLAALIFALGAATPLHRLAYYVIPMIKSFRAPAMMIGVTAFCVATLAGLGFDAARAGFRGRRAAHDKERSTPVSWNARALAFWGLAAIVFFAWLLAAAAPETLAALTGAPGGEVADSGRAAARALAASRLVPSLGITALVWLAGAAILWWGVRGGRLPIAACAAALAFLLVIDLWRVDSRYLHVVEIERAFESGPAVEYLKAQEEPFRILPLPGSLGPNQSVLHRLESVGGLQKFRLVWYDRLIGGATLKNIALLPLWRVLNVRYVLSTQPLQAGFTRVHEGATAVYQWEGDAPRAWVAQESRVVDDEQALALLSDPAFDVRNVALLAEPPPEREEQSSPEPTSPERSSSVRYLEYTPNALEAEVVAAVPSMALFSEAYHPYWEATVDGRVTPVLRADVALRAVPVPAGTHRVRMEYRPRAFERARLVSLLGLAAALAYALAASPAFRAFRQRTR